MPKKKEPVDPIIHTIGDFEPGDIIEFTHPVSKNPHSQTFGVGKLIRVIKRRIGPPSIEVRNSSGKLLITERNIRWDMTMQHKKTKGSKPICYQQNLNTL